MAFQRWAHIVFLGVCFLLCKHSRAYADISVPSTQPFNVQGYIDAAVSSGSHRIVIPPGRYLVTPHNGQHLVLKDLKDVEIIADGVEMVCTETTRALTISDCKNVKIAGLTIDYDPLPFTQGKIVGMSADKRVHDIELFDGYPGAEQAKAFKYEIFRPDTRTLRCRDYDYSIVATGPRNIRLTKTKGSDKDSEQIGDLIVIATEHALGGSVPHAVFVERGSGIVLVRVSLYASNCFGFFEMDSDGTVYDRCKIDRRDPADDPVKRADARLRSLNADAYHSKFAVNGPSLIGCVARFQGDDGVNICGAYHMITAVHGRQLRVLANGALFHPGELVELFSFDGLRLPDAKAVAIEPDGKCTDEEHAFISVQHMSEGFRTKWNPDAYRVTIDREVDLPMGSLICSTQRVGNGFLVKGCDFSFNRSRGILIKASDGQVIDNTLTGNWGYGVLICPEYWWLEAGSSNNVTVRGNKVTDCLKTGIFVTAAGGDGAIAPAGAHNNITIAENTVTNSPLPNIHVTSTDRLQIYRNNFQRPTKSDAGPASAAQDAPMLLENCTNVTDATHSGIPTTPSNDFRNRSGGR